MGLGGHAWAPYLSAVENLVSRNEHRSLTPPSDLQRPTAPPPQSDRPLRAKLKPGQEPFPHGQQFYETSLPFPQEEKESSLGSFGDKRALLAVVVVSVLTMRGSAGCRIPLLLAPTKDVADTLLNYLIIKPAFSISALLTF